MAYYYIKKDFEITSLNISYNIGGLFDKKGQKGISHLMEHLICATFRDLYPVLKKFGIEWNAYTSNDHVLVFFHGLDKYLTPHMKRTLIDRLTGGLKDITEDDFESEKHVVLQEYDDFFNDPESIMNIIRQHFNYFCPIGLKKDIVNFKYSDMNKFYNAYMKKPAKIIEIGPRKTDFSKVPMNEKFVLKPMKLKYKDNYKTPLENIPKNNKSTVTYLNKKLVNKKDFPYLFLAIEMLCDGLESPMSVDIREKQHLTYGVSGGIWEMITQGIIFFQSTTTEENVKKMIKEFNKFFKKVEKYMTKSRLEDIRDNIKVIHEYNEIFRYKNVNKIVRKNYLRVGDVYKTATLEQVKEVAKKYLTLDNFDIVVH